MDAGFRFLVHQNFDLAGPQPFRERRNDGRDHFFDWFADDAGGANHLEGNSTLPACAGVEKKLLIALGSG
jgi:hypothetical protein